MEKHLLLKFIEKYSLGGNIEKVTWEIGPNLRTRFVSPDIKVIGSVTANNVELQLPDGVTNNKAAIFFNSTLVKLLGVLDSEFDFGFTTKNGNVLSSFVFKDKTSKVNFMLADPVAVPTVPDMHSQPSVDITIAVTPDIASKFIRAVNALPLVETFTIEQHDPEHTKISIGSKHSNSTRVDIIVPSEGTLTAPIKFLNSWFVQILNANKEFSHSSLKVTGEGLAQVRFEMTDFVSEYFIAAESEDDE